MSITPTPSASASAAPAQMLPSGVTLGMALLGLTANDAAAQATPPAASVSSDDDVKITHVALRERSENSADSASSSDTGADGDSDVDEDKTDVKGDSIKLKEIEVLEELPLHPAVSGLFRYRISDEPNEIRLPDLGKFTAIFSVDTTKLVVNPRDPCHQILVGTYREVIQKVLEPGQIRLIQMIHDIVKGEIPLIDLSGSQVDSFDLRDKVGEAKLGSPTDVVHFNNTILPRLRDVKSLVNWLYEFDECSKSLAFCRAELARFKTLGIERGMADLPRETNIGDIKMRQDDMLGLVRVCRAETLARKIDEFIDRIRNDTFRAVTGDTVLVEQCLSKVTSWRYFLHVVLYTKFDIQTIVRNSIQTALFALNVLDEKQGAWINSEIRYDPTRHTSVYELLCAATHRPMTPDIFTAFCAMAGADTDAKREALRAPIKDKRIQKGDCVLRVLTLTAPGLASETQSELTELPNSFTHYESARARFNFLTKTLAYLQSPTWHDMCESWRVNVKKRLCADAGIRHEELSGMITEDSLRVVLQQLSDLSDSVELIAKACAAREPRIVSVDERKILILRLHAIRPYLIKPDLGGLTHGKVATSAFAKLIQPNADLQAKLDGWMTRLENEDKREYAEALAAAGRAAASAADMPSRPVSLIGRLLGRDRRFAQQFASLWSRRPLTYATSAEAKEFNADAADDAFDRLASEYRARCAELSLHLASHSGSSAAGSHLELYDIVMQTRARFLRASRKDAAGLSRKRRIAAVVEAMDTRPAKRRRRIVVSETETDEDVKKLTAPSGGGGGGGGGSNASASAAAVAARPVSASSASASASASPQVDRDGDVVIGDAPGK